MMWDKSNNRICFIYGDYRRLYWNRRFGQYILKALSDKNGAGIGLTLGICVAFIGLIFDNLIRTWVEKEKNIWYSLVH